MGVGYERLDTNIKITELPSGQSIFVDMESTLGLPERKLIPMIFGYYRPTRKHGFGWSYFRITRESTIRAVDRNFDDLNVTGNVSLSDKTSFYYLSYNYTAYEDDRAYVFASFGVYGLDIEYNLMAEGAINYQADPVASGEFERNVQQFAPLPLVGLDAWFALTSKWAIGAKVEVVGGEVNNLGAFVLSSKIRARYSFSENFALHLGVNYLDADVTIEKSNRITDIRYGFSGLTLGLDYGF